MLRFSGTSVSTILAGILLVVGALIAVVAILADDLGLSGGGEGFGWKQLIAAIIGSAIALSGLTWLVHSPKRARSNDLVK